MTHSFSRRWLTRSVVGIGFASFFSDLSHETVTSVLPAYLATFGAAAAVLGTVEGIADGASMLAKLYGGWLADRLRRRKPLCAAGYTVMGLSPLIIGTATSVAQIIVGRTLAWVSRGIRTPARKVLLAEAVDPQFYGRAFGLERAMDTAGAIVAPLAVIYLLSIGLKHQQVIMLSIAPGLAAALCIIFLVAERPNHEPVYRPLFTSMGGLPASFYRFLGGVGLFGLGDFADTFYILYAVSVLTPLEGAAAAARLGVTLYVVHNIAYASFSYLGGWLSDHINRRYLLVVGYLCAMLASAFMALGITSLPWLYVMFGIGGVAVGLYETVEDALVADLVPAERLGSAYGALAITTGAGDLISSVVVGWLWAFAGATVAFSGALVVMLAGSIVVMLTARADAWGKRD
ncbi:MAG: MFS transporter [Candidatus Sumerlaeaceae bacterium]|nr:MFS transporter [Candidatus Sumerlaeaceae bacterium]